MAEAPQPKITIGLPVYNGENFVAAAIESILGQTLAELELIICDSGSTDGTEQICREYAARDGRVRYYRSERNHGTARNFNWAFDFASADYFKWFAYDEALAPDLLERCVAALDTAPDAVLCRSGLGAIDGGRQRLGMIAGPRAGLGAGSATTRFGAAILTQYAAREIVGVIRASALIGSCLHGGFPECDRALVAELALRGRFIAAPERPVVGRHRPEVDRAGVPSGRVGAAAWHDPSRGRPVALPLWRLYIEYVRMVRRQLTRIGPRLWCYLYLVRWLAVERNGVRLVRELAGWVAPRLGWLVPGLRARLFGAALPSLAGGGKPGGSTP
jgi:hypothetical protein